MSDQISELLSCLPVDRKETRNEVEFYKCGSKAFLSLTGCSLPEPLFLVSIMYDKMRFLKNRLISNIQFCMGNLKMKRKGANKFDFPGGPSMSFYPDFISMLS